MARRRTQGSRLTQFERKMLEYPPTEKTWICKAKKEDSTCNMILSGSTPNCLLCGKPQGENPQRLWPKYVDACAKVGIEPGILWKEVDGRPFIRIRNQMGWRPLNPDGSLPVFEEPARPQRRRRRRTTARKPRT